MIEEGVGTVKRICLKGISVREMDLIELKIKELLKQLQRSTDETINMWREDDKE